jgi:hypothetical protein
MAYVGATEGEEVGASVQVGGEVGDEGSNVGTTATRDTKGRGGGRRVKGEELEGVDSDGATLALYGLAAALRFVEALAPHFHSGGHRRGLKDVSGKAQESPTNGVFVGHRGVLETCDPAFRVQGIGDGTETGGGNVGLTEACHVPGEAGCAAQQQDQEA